MHGTLDFGLKNKVAIVAGGGAFSKDIGNGRAASILLAEAGAKVIVADRSEELANNTVQMIKDRGGEAIGVGGDLTKSDQCKKVVDLALNSWGRLDILDNNIGIASKLSVVDEEEKDHRLAAKIILILEVDEEERSPDECSGKKQEKRGRGRARNGAKKAVAGL